jgi:hypothetical protein
MAWSIADFWARVEGSLFPHLKENLPPMTEKHRQLVLVLEVVRVEEYVAHLNWHWMGAPPKDRTALARAFVAKTAYNLATTKALRERLQVDETLRRLCGWERRGQIPSESTFSRSFAEFAEIGLTDRVHEALVKHYVGEEIVFHASTDATEIEARERPVRREEKALVGVAQGPAPTGEGTEGQASSGPAAEETGQGGEQEQAAEVKRGPGRPRKGEERPAAAAKPKRRPGRPRKGEEKPPAPTRLEQQRSQSVQEALAGLPTACNVGTKRNSKGHQETWVGFKFHVVVGDDGIPLAAITTSASMHDSQAAIPLMKMTASRVRALYDLMDSAYDARHIDEQSRELGHVPIIDDNPRRGGKEAYQPMEPDRAERYKNRTASERFNARLKDDCGGRMVRVRGHAKVHTHLMFGLLVIFAEALLGL